MVFFLVIQALLWAMPEKKADLAAEARSDFERTFHEAVDSVAPGESAVLEMPEDALAIDGPRSTAYTYYDAQRGFVTRVNWRKLLELDRGMRRHVAYHEACHLRDARRLKERHPLADNERFFMEMRAERCSMPYWRSGAEPEEK